MAMEIKGKNIHFIGIGGIGISAIARMLLLQGKQITGSDRDETRVTEELRKAGVQIFIGAQKENISADCDLVIYTVAIPEDNPEFVEAKKRGIKMLTYPQTLNIISREKYTIAVSGTHGKTTVTAMVAKVMIDAGLDPTVIVGSLIGDTNFIMGKSQYLVVEADEYKKSFHNLEPSILVINNLDLDHLDYYKDLADIQDSFLYLAKKLPTDGFLICNVKLPNLKPIIDNVESQIVDYGGLELNEKLLVPGEHNRQNAKTALAVAKALGLDLKKAEASLAKFAGTWRRFEYKGKMKSGALVYDDYAHNPQKVQAAIQGARELFPGKHLIVAFHPHLFSRTKLLLPQFATAFNDASEVVLAPIFPAREAFDPTISSEILSDEINKTGTKAVALPDFESIEKYLISKAGNDTVIITMGAGDIYKVAQKLVSGLE